MLPIMMPDVPLHPNGIPLQEFNEQMMMDKHTCWAYISDSLASFCSGCVEHKPGWFTAYAQNKMILPETEAAGIGTREEKNRVRNSLVELIQHAAEEAIMMLSAITPAGYLVYLQSLRHF